jgi:glycosidase
VNGGVLSALSAVDGERLAWILSNHDSFAGDRPWNQLGGDAEAYRLAAAIYLLASRNPFTYYGEEVGMANAAALSGDHALRTPMSWTSDTTTAGFTTGTPFRELSANVASNNVADEEGVAGSLLEYYRTLYALRNAYPVIAGGAVVPLASAGDPVLVLRRQDAEARAVIAVNLSASARQVNVATERANTAFDGVFGAADQRLSDDNGDLTVDVPARSVVVYHAATP